MYLDLMKSISQRKIKGFPGMIYRPSLQLGASGTETVAV
jgi:hypothetical protein